MLLEIEYSSLPVRNGEQALCQAVLTGLLDQNNIFPIEGIHSCPSFCYLMTAISVLVKKKNTHTTNRLCPSGLRVPIKTEDCMPGTWQ